jgi:hypothetical protein
MRLRRIASPALLSVAAALLLSTPAGAKQLPIRPVAQAAGTDAGTAVLPSRVANAITRAQNLLDKAGLAVDTNDTASASAMLKGLQTAVLRVNKAATAQMNAPADPNAEEGATPGPDSVIGALTLDQTVITTVAGLFDTKAGTTVTAATHALFATMNARDKLLNAVLALPAEGAGADYADGMSDTLAGYDDEVANITEALSDDTLSAGGKGVLSAALTQSQKTDTAINAAFGGGE